jgi:hypothetical protein
MSKAHFLQWASNLWLLTITGSSASRCNTTTRKDYTTKQTGMRKLLSLARSLLQAGPGQPNPDQTRPAAAPGTSRPAGVPGQEANGAIIQALSNLPRQRPRVNNPAGTDTAAQNADVYINEKVVWLMDPDYYHFQTCVCDTVRGQRSCCVVHDVRRPYYARVL